MDKKNRAIIYVRVSSHEQVEGYSIGEQTERLRKYCEVMEWIVVRVYTDPGYSGSNMDRPALKELIRAVEDGLADRVVVYKLDRLSRSQKDTLYLIEDVFLKNNVDFVSLSENFDTGTAFGRAMIGILAVFAQLERETIKERMAMGREARAKDGYYIGGDQILIGYDYKDGLLSVNEHEAAIVRRIFDLFIAGMPIRTIANTMNEAGLYRNAKWTSTTLCQLLRNRHYIGEVKFSGKWYPGRHEPLISLETFNAAKEILRIRSESIAWTNKHSRPLTGFIWCAYCGARYHRQPGGLKKDGTRNIYYCCYSKSHKVKERAKAATCNNKTYKAEELEEIVFNEIRKLAVDPEYLKAIRKKDDIYRPRDDSGAIKKEIDALTAQISKYMDLYALDRLSLQEVDDKIAPLTDKRDKLEATYNRITANLAVTTEKVRELATSFGEIIDRGSLDEIRLALEALIRKIVIYGDDIEIHWNFS